MKKKSRKKNEGNSYVVYMIMIFISIFAMAIISQKMNFTSMAVLDSSKDQSIAARQDAFDSLIKAEDTLAEIPSFNLTAYYIRDILLEAKRSFIGDKAIYINDDIAKETNPIKLRYYESLLETAKQTPAYEIRRLNYSETIRLADLIEYKKEQIYRIRDTIPLLEEKSVAYKENGINVSTAMGILEEAKKSFIEERYDEADKYLADSDLALEEASSEFKRVKEAVLLSKNFFVRYWWQAVLALLALAVLTPLVIDRIKKNIARRKIDKLKLETQALTKLIKKAQEDCFMYKKITESTYRIKANKYKSRIAEINHTIPVLELIALGKKGENKKESKKIGVLEIKDDKY